MKADSRHIKGVVFLLSKEALNTFYIERKEWAKVLGGETQDSDIFLFSGEFNDHFCQVWIKITSFIFKIQMSKIPIII